MRDIRVPQGTSQMRYQAPSMRLGRSQFDLSHNHKTTFDASYLIPYLCLEVVPGDTITCRLNALSRIFSPLAAPIMDDIELSIDFFYVPNRIVWDNWEAFLGAHDAAGAQDTDYTIPVLASGTADLGEVHDYFGIPQGTQFAQNPVNILPYRAYRLIYNEWYRDQNLIDSIVVDTGDGPDATAGLSELLKSAKKHDYFTSALPYLQKGEAQNIFEGAGTTIPVRTDASAGTTLAVTNASDLLRGIVTSTATATLDSTVAASDLFVDLGDLDVTINALRESAAIQRLLERDARAGTRHPELIRAHFGVDVPDYRTQRPEYLGGGRGYINVSPVQNTSPVDATNSPDGQDWNAGQLAGQAAGTLTASFAKSFVEHGHVIGILRARAALSYSQGLERMWSRSTKYDFLWPELAHLGEQPIYNKELYVSNAAADDLVFGYQERYADYRFKKSLVTGKFSPAATGSLDFWHLSEDFASLPTLGQTFIEDQSPMSRVTIVTTEPDFIIDGRFNIKRACPLPVRPVPTLSPARF